MYVENQLLSLITFIEYKKILKFKLIIRGDIEVFNVSLPSKPLNYSPYLFKGTRGYKFYMKRVSQYIYSKNTFEYTTNRKSKLFPVFTAEVEKEENQIHCVLTFSRVRRRRQSYRGGRDERRAGRNEKRDGKMGVRGKQEKLRLCK